MSQNGKLFYFLNAEEKNWASFQRIIEIFTQKFVTKLYKIWGWDPGSGKKPIPDYRSQIRVQGQKGTWSRISDPDPQHCKKEKCFCKDKYCMINTFVGLLKCMEVHNTTFYCLTYNLIFV